MELNNDNFLKYLNPTRSIYSVLGNICINPFALKDPEVYLAEEDFLQDFHKIVFSAINNIVYSGAEVTKITEVDIDNFLAPHEKLYKIWEDNQGITYMKKAIEHSNVSTFKYNYDLLKKYSLLRDYYESGISISDIFDFESQDLKAHNEGKQKIENMKLEEMVEHFAQKMVKLKNKWNITKNAKNFTAGDDLDTLLDEMNQEPEFGYPFANGYYNAIFRGMRPGKFMLRSATTGGGKTRQSLADMCSISCDEIYHFEKGWIKNGVSKPTLFISTELEKRELQTVMLAYITGIDEGIIKNGNYSDSVYKRLKKGIEVLKKAPIYAVYVDDFSITDIEGIIEQYILEKKVEYVAFDYIQMTAKLSRTMQNAFGSALREDQILVQFSGAMKLLANKYQIYIISSTQLNRNSKDVENRDTQSLRGGSATADKVDHGVMSFRATAKDHENLKHILEKNTFKEKPNFSHWVYKNRSGRTAVIIWTLMNMGNLREEILFMTDTDFNLITDIKPVEIEMADYVEEFEQEMQEDIEIDF